MRFIFIQSANLINMIIGIYGIQDIKLSDFPEFVHDHAIAVFEGGKCRHFMQLERFTGKKYDNRMHEYLYPLMREMKLAGNHDAEVVFTDNVIGRSFISFDGDIRFEAPLGNSLAEWPEEGLLRWYGKEKKGYIVNHELAHIFSCMLFFGDFKDKSLLVHFDGGASKGNFSVWIYKDGKPKLIETSWRLKYLSNLFNANALTFSLAGGSRENQNAVPGKFMGLAACGKYSPELEIWLKENRFFEGIWTNKKHFFESLKKQWGITLGAIDNRNSFMQDIAATFQYIFERDFMEVLSQLKTHYDVDYLYYTGGSALNIPLNARIVESRLFKDVFIPPCTNDSGLALGAAAFFQYHKNIPILPHSPFLNSLNVPEKYSYTAGDVKQTASLLAEGKIIGVCNGHSETGPRALGNRSILCRADSAGLAKKLSMQIKGREWYRPLAPIMLVKNARYFTGLKNIHHLSQYMLLEFFIPELHREELSGAVHINNTARIQTVFEKEPIPFIYDLLVYLDEHYGIKALINTSFNVQGKPIIHYPKTAVNDAKTMGLDGVVINGRIIAFDS